MSTLSRSLAPVLLFSGSLACRADSEPSARQAPAPAPARASDEPANSAEEASGTGGWCTGEEPLLFTRSYDLYSSSGVRAYYEDKTGHSLPARSGLQGGAASFDLTAARHRYLVPLTVGSVPFEINASLPSPSLDTGSAGITVDCDTLFANVDGVECDALSPQFVSEVEVYVTDIKFTRCYGGSSSKPDQGTKQTGLIALATVALGSVSAAIPVGVVTQYENSAGPIEPPSSAIVGVNSSAGGHMVSPVLYFDYGASPTDLNVGFILDDSPALTIGVDPNQLGDFTLQPLVRSSSKRPPAIPSHIWKQLASPTLAATVSVIDSSGNGPSDVTLDVLFDTGTKNAGHLGAAPPADCAASGGCKVTAAIEGTTVVTLEGADMRIETTGNAVFGLDFMTANEASDQFLVDFDQAAAGFASEASR